MSVSNSQARSNDAPKAIQEPVVKRTATSNIKTVASKGDITLDWLLQATTIVLEFLTVVFTLSMLFSYDQSPSTIESLNWGWIENKLLNDLPGFQNWCTYQFAGEDCTDSAISFRADVRIGLHAAKIKAWVWDARSSERRGEYTTVALDGASVSDNACAIPMGMCDACNRPTNAAFTMILFLVLLSIVLLVQDSSTMWRMNLHGIRFLWSRFAMHLTSLILISIALGLVLNNCFNTANSGMTLNFGPMAVIGIVVLVFILMQFAIQVGLFVTNKQRGHGVAIW